MVEDCFASNTTLNEYWAGKDMVMKWFVERNRICNELKANMVMRNSIPQHLPVGEMRQFLYALMKNSEPLRSMKLVVLGHGRIGKTTLLNAMRNILDANNHKV